MSRRQIALIDSKQRPIEPFSYNDIVYLPARAISNALGKEVNWDPKTSSVNIGTPSESDSTIQPNTAPDLEGIKLFPSDNLWNTPVDNLKVHPKSEKYISIIGGSKHLHPDFGTFWEGSPIGIPYNIVSSAQPKVNVIFDYDYESGKGPYPISHNPLVEGGSDKHLLILQKETNILYELFNAQKSPDGSWHAGSGAIWHLNKNEQRPQGWTSADAAGLAILPGLVRWDDEVLNALKGLKADDFKAVYTEEPIPY